MENLKDRYIELLQKKFDALNSMREATLEQIFTGDETLVDQESEAFIALYEKRAEVLERVEKIDDALELLDPLEAEDLTDKDFQARAAELRRKMTELAKEMVDLDKANMAAYEKMSAHVRDDLKQARQGQELLHGYDDYLDANEGHFMDKKKV